MHIVSMDHETNGSHILIGEIGTKSTEAERPFIFEEKSVLR
jgi:hypothetical protein